MRWKLGWMFLGIFMLPLICGADTLQFGVGLKTSLLSYNEDELDTSKMFWGAHGRVRLVKYFAGEASYQTREDNFQINDGRISLTTRPLQFSGVVYPLAMIPVSPYLLAGYGWYFLTANITGDVGLPYVFGEGSLSLTEAAPHIGAGVEVFAGDHFSAGVDVRKIFLDFQNQLVELEYEAYMVNVGATFYF